MKEILDFMNVENDDVKKRSFGVLMTPLGKLLNIFEKELSNISKLEG